MSGGNSWRERYLLGDPLGLAAGGLLPYPPDCDSTDSILSTPSGEAGDLPDSLAGSGDGSGDSGPPGDKGGLGDEGGDDPSEEPPMDIAIERSKRWFESLRDAALSSCALLAPPLSATVASVIAASSSLSLSPLWKRLASSSEMMPSSPPLVLPSTTRTM